MEKYQAFTDASVGINPFAQSPWRPTLSQRALGAVLLVLRLPPLLLLVAPLLLFADAAAGAAPPGAAARLARRWLVRPLARAALFLLGFHRIERIVEQRSLFPAAPPAAAAAAAAAGGGRGAELLVANCCGAVDALGWAALSAPVFLALSADGLSLQPCGLAQALRNAARRAGGGAAPPPAPPPPAAVSALTPPLLPAPAALQLTELLLDASEVFLLQPEAAPSNGRAVLAFSPALLTALAAALPPAVRARAPRVRVAALFYQAAEGVGGRVPSPCLVAGSAARHFLALAMQPSNMLALKEAPDVVSPQLPPLLHADAAWAAAARDVLCRVLRVRGVSLDAGAQAAFVNAVAAATSAAATTATLRAQR